MMSKNPKLIVIVGPTASGKSELAVNLAKKLNGEIISADSRQIYRGLDIGTAKPTKKEMRGIPHHLMDVAGPEKVFTVFDFKKLAEKKIQETVRRGKIPIIVGGTGFWIDALVFDMEFPRVLPNQKFRRELSKKSAAELLEILRKLDPYRAKTVEQKNPRRLIRAIEITRALGYVPKLFKKESPYNVLWIGLNPKEKLLKKRIARRADTMITRGLIQETKKLLKGGVGKKRIRELGFEYRAALNYIEGKISRKEFHSDIMKETRQYTRRQMVWFKKNKEIHWLANPAQAGKLTKYFLNKIRR